MKVLSRLFKLPWYVKYPLLGIYLFALFTARFNSTCESDGCIGVGIPLGVTVMLAAVQLFITVPTYVYSPARRAEGALSPAFVLGASILPTVVAFFLVIYRWP